jgi:hypothetical protein
MAEYEFECRRCKKVFTLFMRVSERAAARIPTLLLFDGGLLRDRLVGAHPRGVLEARLGALLARTAR